MSETKDLVIQQSDLTQISSELYLLEQMIEYGSLNAIWEKTDHLKSLFETLPHGDKDIEIVRQQFREMVCPTEEMKRQMQKRDEEIEDILRDYEHSFTDEED